MNPKSKDASISDRLEHIKQQRGHDAAQELVAKRRLGAAQPEADAWAARQLRKRTWPRAWGVVVGIAGIIGAIATVVPLFARALG